MNKSSNFFLYTGLLILFLSNSSVASADTTLTPGQVQLSVAGILLDVEGSSGTLDQISFSGTSFDIIVSSGQTVTFSSADRRQLSYSPSSASTYITRSCTSAKSSLAINGSGLSSPLTITITPESSTCTSGSDGGGGIVTGNNKGYNFGPTPVIISAPALPLLTPPSKITPSKLPPSQLQPTPTTPFDSTVPVFIPPQSGLPEPKTPSVPSTVATPVTVGDFMLLYWQWIVAALTGLTLLGISLFITLRE